jgi:putative ATPase
VSDAYRGVDHRGQGDLFASGGGLAAPLAVRMRPRTLQDILGQEHLLHPGGPLSRLARPGKGPAGPLSVIVFGPPGSGKTTLAHVISASTDSAFVELSAVTATVKDVRSVMQDARRTQDLHARRTVLFLDEIHRFTKAQQDALLPGVENGWVVLVAATTENPSFSVISPLLSRSLVFRLDPLAEHHLATLLDRAVTDEHGLAGSVRLDDDARDHLVRLAAGDARRALTALEAAAGLAFEADQSPPEDLPRITLDLAQRAVATAALDYDKDGDQHYDVASAFIKSIRGSDVDAALHYLARMIEAGEDPRFIARRVMISAAEDVGLADPSALSTAVAAAQAVALIGMPEARIILAEAVVHLSLAPKSNAAYLGIDAALADVRAGRAGRVPAHLRDAHYPGAAAMGHGVGYVYAHDHPHGVAAQQHLPDTLAGAEYYRPTVRGFERELSARLQRLRELLSTPSGDGGKVAPAPDHTPDRR